MAHLNIGNFLIDCVVDLERPFLEAKTFFPDLTDDMLAHCRHVLPKTDITPEGRLQMRFQSFLLRTERHNILIDTCCGNDKHRPGRDDFDHLNTDYIGALARAGIRPEQVDFVMCTHLHWDHVGWNTRLLDGKWVPTFPNARYIVGRTEYDYWHTRFQRGDEGIHLISFEDSVLPVVRTGQSVLVDDDYALEDGLWFESAPGHTPGNVVIHARSGDQTGVFMGDVIHHPLQLLRPQWSTLACTDPELSRKTRTRLIEEHAARGTRLLPAHFPSPTVGHIVRHGTAYSYTFE